MHIAGEQIACIKHGLLVFVGFGLLDDMLVVPKIIEKLLTVRLFSDDSGKMNHKLQQMAGELLLVSQLTLMASSKGGRRPDFGWGLAP